MDTAERRPQNDDMIRATINGQILEFEQHMTILEAARSLGVEIPALGHDKRLHLARFLDIFTADAARLNRQDGVKVRPRSTLGDAVLQARLSAGVKRGDLIATFYAAVVFLNNVTIQYHHNYTLTPEYKVTAVRVEPL